MAGTGDGLGALDDRTVVHRRGRPLSETRWGLAGAARAVGGILAAVLLGVAGMILDPPWSYVAVLVLVVGALTAYVLWRRDRNRRLTGSPTTWPG